MKRILIPVSVLLFFLLAINQESIAQTEGQNLIYLKPDFKNSGPVNMSELFSEIQYIPLETKPECLIGNMYVAIFGNEIILRSHSDQSIRRFTSKGKYLNKIGNQGRGPGEYQDNTDIVLIGDTVFVISNFAFDVLCYSLDGSFLKKYHIELEGRPKSMARLADNSYMISLSNKSSVGNIIKTDKDFNVIEGYIESLPMKSNANHFKLRKTREKVYYYYNYLDTIYDLAKGYPVPEIVVDYGKYKVSKHKLSVNKKNNVILNSPSISDFHACENYLHLIAYYPLTKGRYNVLYRFEDGKQIAWSELVNDIDSGTFDRWQGSMMGDQLVFHLMPTTIIKRLSLMTEAEKKDPKNFGFVEMAAKITLESNPVIMLCKFSW